MEPEQLRATAFRDQLWASLPVLQPEIDRLVQGDLDGSERQVQLIQLLARVVTAELQFRAEDSRLEP